MYTVPQENDRLNREGNKKKVKCEGYGNWVLLERPGFEDYSTLRKEKRYLFLPVSLSHDLLLPDMSSHVNRETNNYSSEG